MLSDALLEQIIEGALLASGQTLSVDRIQNLFEEGSEPEKERILMILERIGEKCQNNGYELIKVATGYRFQVKQDVVKWVSRLWDEKPQRYSRALLETLSIIAYRQPCTRGEIEDVRGVAVSSHITKTLVEREWIQVVGHRDVPGRPAMFATTKMFLDYFNLESLDQLPTLEEIQDIADANHALELEDKKQEGDFDLSISVQEMGDSENLQSAAADLEAADALVQQVEDNLFAKAAEEEQQAEKEAAESELNTSAAVQNAEQDVATSDDAVFAISDSLRASLEGNDASDGSTIDTIEESAEGMTEEQLAEATIARMIAEQEALLKQAGKGQGSFESKPVSQTDSEQAESVEDATLNHDVISNLADGFASLASKPEGFDTDVLQPDAPSVFGVVQTPEPENNNEEGEEALAAALEEEMMAQLEAEQEALLEEQEQNERSLDQ
jgi:segregation and condensation protein B